MVRAEPTDHPPFLFGRTALSPEGKDERRNDRSQTEPTGVCCAADKHQRLCGVRMKAESCWSEAHLEKLPRPSERCSIAALDRRLVPFLCRFASHASSSRLAASSPASLRSLEQH